MLLELNRAGWAVQVVPQDARYGVSLLTLVWSLRRDELNTEIDGAIAALPIVIPDVPATREALHRCVGNLYARVFPISPYGDLWSLAE